MDPRKALLVAVAILLGVFFTFKVVRLVLQLVAWRTLSHQLSHVEPERLKVGTGAPFEAGRAIHRALEAYRAEHGAYPQDLAALVPKYLQQIPPPGWGLNWWDYGTWKDSFSLRVFHRHTGFIDSNYYKLNQRGNWIYHRDSRVYGQE